MINKMKRTSFKANNGGSETREKVWVGLLTGHLGYIPDIHSRPTGCTTREWRRSVCWKERHNSTFTFCDNWNSSGIICTKRAKQWLLAFGEQSGNFYFIIIIFLKRLKSSHTDTQNRGMVPVGACEILKVFTRVTCFVSRKLSRSSSLIWGPRATLYVR